MTRHRGLQDLPDADRVAEALDRIWERPEFTPADPSWFARTFARLRETVLDWITNLFSGIGIPDAWAAGFGRVLMVVLLAAGVGGLGYLIWRAISSGRPTSGGSRASGATPTPQRDTARAWEERAGTLAAERRFREAALALYRSVILRLAAAQFFRVREGRTPGEYAREAATRRPESREPFRHFLARFHAVAFGPLAPDAGSFEALREAADPLTRLARRPRGTDG